MEKIPTMPHTTSLNTMFVQLTVEDLGVCLPLNAQVGDPFFFILLAVVQGYQDL